MELAKLPVDVTLVDRKNYHTFQPCSTRWRWRCFPRRTSRSRYGRSCRPREHRSADGRGVGFDLDQRQVRLKTGSVLAYDYLIVATGRPSPTLGVKIGRSCAGLKTIDDALEMRRRVLLRLSWRSGR